MQQYLSTLYGLPVRDFPAPGEPLGVPDPSAVAWRISVSPFDPKETETYAQAFQRFRETVPLAELRALVIGQWAEPYDNNSSDAVRLLVECAPEIASLRGLFVGDLEIEDAEISWIEQSDVTPLLEAFPDLEEFGVRGGNGLELKPVRHEALRTLTVETGGLPGTVAAAISASELPALEGLEIWLGVDEYGGTTTVADLQGILEGSRLPELQHLGLQNSELQDQIAVALADPSATVVPQLRRLDLSMGTLSDEGGEALLNGQPLGHLKLLNLSHHYLSEGMAQRIKQTLSAQGVSVNVSDRQKSNVWRGEEYRYAAVTE